MTEQEWLACTDPEPMLEFLRDATGRKLRLFACACCRHTAFFREDEWKRLEEHAARWQSRVYERLERLFQPRWPSNMGTAVEWAKAGADLARRAADLAEQVADGLGDLAELRALFPADDREEMEYCYAGGADAARAAKSSAYLARHCARYVTTRSYPPGARFRSPSEPDYERERSAQSDLLRDIFGNPFRPVAADPSWLTSTVVELAHGVYAEKAFDRLPILADALQDAGCEQPDILAHCRQPDEHVRGCWPVDALLGKG